MVAPERIILIYLLANPEMDAYKFIMYLALELDTAPEYISQIRLKWYKGDYDSDEEYDTLKTYPYLPKYQFPEWKIVRSEAFQNYINSI